MWQFDLMEAQIQCPPLLHEQLKKAALEAWIELHLEKNLKIAAQTYYKGLMKPMLFFFFLARLGITISYNVVGEEAKVQIDLTPSKKSCDQTR